LKIAVCGKGGSGKSIIAALLANGLRARGYRILVVDSDESNSELYRLLGFDHPPVPLMEMLGGKKGLREKMAVRISSGESETKMEVLAQDRLLTKDIPARHLVQCNGVSLLNIGKILHSLEGCACPMGVLSREFLGKLYLETDEVVVVDMEAGVEHFGRGIETSIDQVLAIVEPSLESLGLAVKVKELAAGAGVSKTRAVLNKISSDKISERLKEALEKKGMDIIGVVHYDPRIFEACLEGHKLGEDVASEDIRRVVDRLLSNE
jgi:CO dehydrogenase maturation factor